MRFARGGAVSAPLKSIVACTICIGFAGCSQKQEQSVILPTVTYTVSGTVSDSFGGPVAQAMVTIRDKQEYTDAVGHYEIPGLAPTSYVLECTKDGYESFESPAFEVSNFNRSYDVRLRKYYSFTGTSTKDTYVHKLHPGDNYGSSNFLYSGGLEGYSDQDGLVYFDFSSIPRGAEILTTKLFVYARGDGGSILFVPVRSGWVESAVTWASRPIYTDTWPLGYVGAVGVNSASYSWCRSDYNTETWDLPPFVAGVVSGDIVNEGFALITWSQGSSYNTVSTRESQEKPRIEISYVY